MILLVLGDFGGFWLIGVGLGSLLLFLVNFS